MASFTDDGIEVLRPYDTKYTKSPKNKGYSVKHKTRTPADAFKQSEQSLRELLEDFESGRLNAFGDSDMLQKMNVIRERQEKLTLKHFEIDQIKVDPDNKKEGSEDSLIELTQGLEKLGTAIQNLHSDNTLLRGHNVKPTKTVSLKPMSGDENV